MHSVSNPIIEVKKLSRSYQFPTKEEGWGGVFELLTKPKYKTTEALKTIDFQIEEGSFIGLIGANGAGKTTLLKILSGLIPPSLGSAQVMGFDPFKRSLEFRKNISLVMGQKAQLWWDLSALDAFDLLRAIYEIPSPLFRERLKTLTELLDVQKHLKTQIRKLSLGERMKMEIMGSLLHWPKVIFLDEPTIGLDVLSAHKLREFLRVFNQNEKATIILTSHNMDDIERLCPRILILRTGELIYDGPPEKLIQREEIQLRIRLMQNPSLDDVSQITEVPLKQIASEKTEELTLILFCIKRDQIIPTLQRLISKFQIIDMGIEEQSLESAIQRIYEKTT